MTGCGCGVGGVYDEMCGQISLEFMTNHTGSIPVGSLNANEDTKYDNDKINDYRKPVL